MGQHTELPVIKSSTSYPLLHSMKLCLRVSFFLLFQSCLGVDLMELVSNRQLKYINGPLYTNFSLSVFSFNFRALMNFPSYTNQKESDPLRPLFVRVGKHPFRRIVPPHFALWNTTCPIVVLPFLQKNDHNFIHLYNGCITFLFLLGSM